jgi:hypothetical protein
LIEPDDENALAVIVIEAGATNFAPLMGEETVTIGGFTNSAAAATRLDAAAAASGSSAISAQTVTREFLNRRFPIVRFLFY